MQVSVRSHLSAGVAVIGAGAIVLSPVQPITAPTALSPVATRAIEVGLASSINPITPIITTIRTTIANTATLVSNWLANPFPIAQTIADNWLFYFSELPAIGAIISQIFTNVGNAIRAPFSPGALDFSAAFPDLAIGENISTIPVTSVDLPSPLSFTLPISQSTIYGLLPSQLGTESTNALTPLLNFLNTPVSGALFGLYGPLIAPFVALGNGVGSALAALEVADIAGAINNVINIPTNMINALLNGGVNLDLTPLVKAILPASVTSIGLNLGGLLTTFTSTVGSDTFPVGTVQIGGVGFDSLSLTATIRNPISQLLPDVNVSGPGIPIGLAGGLISLTRFFAGAIDSVPTVAPAPAKSPAAQPRRAVAGAGVAHRESKPAAARRGH